MFKQFGRVPHQAIMDSIKLMSKYVMPYFRSVPSSAGAPATTAAAD